MYNFAILLVSIDLPGNGTACIGHQHMSKVAASGECQANVLAGMSSKCTLCLNNFPVVHFCLSNLVVDFMATSLG